MPVYPNNQGSEMKSGITHQEPSVRRQLELFFWLSHQRRCSSALRSIPRANFKEQSQYEEDGYPDSRPLALLAIVKVCSHAGVCPTGLGGSSMCRRLHNSGSN